MTNEQGERPRWRLEPPDGIVNEYGATLTNGTQAYQVFAPPVTSALADYLNALEDERDRWKEAEQSLGAAYLRLRELIGQPAFDTPTGPTREQVWVTTEAALTVLRDERGRLADSVSDWSNAANEFQVQRDRYKATLEDIGKHVEHSYLTDIARAALKSK